jgi:hypothetical protein
VSYPRDVARIDIGLFGPDGFRGWSGSERSQVWLGPTGATPGYLPGEVSPGTWEVLLGLYVVPDEGADVLIEVGAGRPHPGSPASHRPPLGARPPRRQLPSDGPRRWLAGDLHCHTVHSDGALSVFEVARAARAAGLDFLAVTDHNTVSHYAELAAASNYSGVELVPGQEVTSYMGHANALGPIDWVDFRRPADSWMAEVTARGGLLSVNHPIAGDLSWRQVLARPPHLIELWPGGWDRRWGPLADAVIALRAELAQPVPVGGSDFHRPGQHEAVGRPTTWVLADDGDVLDGLRSGRVTISAGWDGALLVPVGDRLAVIGGDGAAVCDQGGRRRSVISDWAEVAVGEGLHWLESPYGVEAVCDPHTFAVPQQGAGPGE